ncbi:MAG: tetratricopeptide repeat protein [Anaerolineales bacterium]|nr:tetratricopeptide repeat protein [Anaerolineales bacterium]
MNSSKVVEVDQPNFRQEVIQRSYQQPVVVDFWAPWCGPCRILGPILERLAAEPNSKFILAKVNSDQNPGLSAQYGVQGIPNVKAFRQGQIVDEFVGAQPEPVVRQFIQRLTVNMPPGAATTSPRSADPATRLSQARQLLKQRKGCEAQNRLQNFPPSPQTLQAQLLLPLAQFMCDQGRVGGDQAVLNLLFQQAADALQRGEYSTALYNLLAAMRQDKNYRQSQAERVINGLFELLGENDPLTQSYRQQIIMLAG